MTLMTFYSGILARRRLGSPTVEETRRDFQILLDARLIPVPYL